MGDVFLDFREREERQLPLAATLMRYYTDIDVELIEREEFGLIVSRPDDTDIWGAYQSPEDGMLVALAGRIALESTEWEAARQIRGKGGLACKAICKMYRAQGLGCFERLNGNFCVLVYDPAKEEFHIATDRCGMVLCFGNAKTNELVFSTHPDILAAVVRRDSDFDLISMAEFVMTGRISFPYTYYKDVTAIDYGSVHTIRLGGQQPNYKLRKKYFSFDFKFDQKIDEWGLAEELCVAFRRAVNRRVFSQFGQTAISLSGGLDSRTLLCSAENPQDLWTFCFFDERNLECAIAEAIAKEAGARFIPLKRDFEHYGDSAEDGVRISCAFGNLGNNHFLGFRESLQNAGIQNVISGFYCDYLFKGLALDTEKTKILKKERLAAFRPDVYYRHYYFDTPYLNPVKERLRKLFPEELIEDNSEFARQTRAHRRIFPLYYEPDNQETTVPQRVMGWYLPIVDNDIIDVYLKTPPSCKLNTSFFEKVSSLQCGANISKIMDVNTRTRVNASHFVKAISLYKSAISRKLKMGRGLATDLSWPNWKFYVQHSPKIRKLWLRPNPLAQGLLTEIIKTKKLAEDIKEYNLDLFLRLLTLKVWLDQRCGSASG